MDLDLHVGDFVYAVYDDGWTREGHPRLEMQRAQVTKIGPKKIFLGNHTGLAFRCRTQFNYDGLGSVFEKTPEAALATFHLHKKLQEEAYLRNAEECRMLQTLTDYSKEWERKRGLRSVIFLDAPRRML